VTRLPSDRKPLGDRSVEELLHMAEEISAMAAAAVTPSAKRSLERLATRFRVFAASRANAHQPSGQAVRPGEPPLSGAIRASQCIQHVGWTDRAGKAGRVAAAGAARVYLDSDTSQQQAGPLDSCAPGLLSPGEDGRDAAVLSAGE
jgi:hypothetical protein